MRRFGNGLDLASPPATVAPKFTNSGDLNMINILDLGSKHPTDNGPLFTYAASLGQLVYVPDGIWPIVTPITYGSNGARFIGAGGFNSGGKFTVIRNTLTSGYEPALHREGHYLRYSGNPTAPHQWVSTSGSANSVQNDAVVHFENIYWSSFSSQNDIVQAFGVKKFVVRQCGFEPFFRGLSIIRPSMAQVHQCTYAYPANVYPEWVLDTDRVKNAWGFMSTGNTRIDQCNCQGGMLGVGFYGDNNHLRNGRYEVLHHGIEVGGYSPDPATLNQLIEPKCVTLQNWNHESCRRPLKVRFGPGCVAEGFNIFGLIAPTDGTSGEGIGRYSIRIYSKSANAFIGYGVASNNVDTAALVDANENPITSGYPLIAGGGAP